MEKTYIASERRVPARPRSAHLQGVTTTSARQTTQQASTARLWHKELDNDSPTVVTEMAAKVCERLTLLSADGSTVTLSVVDGHLHVDTSVVSAADMVAHGAEGDEIASVESIVETTIAQMRDAGLISSGAGISAVSIDYDAALYKFRVRIIDGNNASYYSDYVDLPIETFVVSGSYDVTSKALVLTLRDGTKVSISVSQLVAGLASETYVNSKIATEVTNRNSAISSAIATEVTNRNNAISSAIATEVTNRNNAIDAAIATEVTNRNSAISSAIATEVTNRNTAITNAVNALDVASVGGADRVLTTISETNGKIAASQRYSRVKSGFIFTNNTTWRYMKIATLIHAEPRRLPMLIHGKEGWNNNNDGWFGVLTISCNYYKTWGATLRIMRGTEDSVNVKFYIIYDSGSQGNATLWIDLCGNQYNSYTYSVIAPEDHITHITLHSHTNSNNGATSTSPLTEDKTWLEVPTREVAYKTDNVASATKLQAARALWGQSFDGTADVNGDMEFAPGTNGRVLRILTGGSFRLQAPTTGDWVCGFLGRNAANTQNLAGFGVFGTANTINYYYMGIGHGSPCLKVTPAGDMTINGSMVAKGDVTAYSDARVKSDVKELSPRGVLRPVSYTKDGRQGIGFIAQEVREVYPELVREDEDGMLSLNYNGLVAVLYAEVQELRQVLKEIKG